jgi:release factor glutamine methyltransferase
MIPEKNTPKSFLILFEKRLETHYTLQEIRSIFYWVMSYVTHRNRSSLILTNEQPLNPDQCGQIIQILDRLDRGEPIQYIIGMAPFLDLEISVSPDVLIPRPETEELASLIIQDFLPLIPPGGKVLDIGTGSGCLALAIKNARKDLIVTGVDCSSRALEIARKNSQSLDLEIHWIEGDILKNDRLQKGTRFDLITSNPPYIPQKQKQAMMRHITDYEPNKALFVPDDDPLLFYKKIRGLLSEYLAPYGTVCLEVHEQFADDVAKLFEDILGAAVKQQADFRGKPRFVFIYYPATYQSHCQS